MKRDVQIPQTAYYTTLHRDTKPSENIIECIKKNQINKLV